MNPVMSDVLHDAAQALKRGASYGEPHEDFTRIAALWDVLRPEGSKYEAHDVAMYLICLKLSRLAESPKHRDSWVDIAGYAACGYECAVWEEDERQAAFNPSPTDRFTTTENSTGRVGVEVPAN